MRQEFPALADVWPDSLSRGNFLRLMGASLALAGVGGCSVKPAPQGTIVPYVRSPEEIIPGRPMFFATTMIHDGDAVGLLVESHEGRPTKIEGNPDHPASLGATNIFNQASVLTLYDPARSQTVVRGDQNPRLERRGGSDLEGDCTRQLRQRGRGVRLLTEAVLSPDAWPADRAAFSSGIRKRSGINSSQSAIANANDHRGGVRCRPVDMICDFGKADVVLALDADFLTEGPGHLRYARDFMERRRVGGLPTNKSNLEMNRLYVVETSVSCTGAKADHRLAMKMSEIERFARRLAARVGVGEADKCLIPGDEKWISAVADDLEATADGASILVGRRQPMAVHLLAH